jgi:hypothetical protein
MLTVTMARAAVAENRARPERALRRGGEMTAGGEQEFLEDRRRESFRALVIAQDHAVGVARSRKLVAERFGVSEQQVRDIEREGLEGEWPPL